MRTLRSLLSRTLLGAALLSGSLAAQDFDPFAEPEAAASRDTKSSLLSEYRIIQPGQTFTVALKLTHAPGWHSYYINPGFVGAPPELSWTLPEGFTAGPLRWPTPHMAETAGLKLYGYEETNHFLVDLTAPDGLTPGETIAIKLDAKWQTCKEQCIDESGSFDLNLTVAETAEKDPALTDDFKAAYEHQPLSGSESWKTQVEVTDEALVFTLTPSSPDLPDLENVYFYSATQHTDAQAAQSLAREGDAYTLTVPRASETPLGKPLPELTSVEGILSSPSGWEAGTKNKGLTVSIPLAASEAPTAPASEREPLARADQHSLPKTLALAFLGGIILNLMPCVFPVLGLKIMGFVEQSQEDPKKIRMHGLVFAAGLMISLWIVAGILIGLIVSGQHLGWGFQLNDSRFLAAMILLLFVLGLNLIGVFEIGTSLTGVGSDLQHKKGYSGSFFTGVLTTLVATPCTGPFLGVAMGFALQQPAYISLLVFTALGLGIAFPYVLLAFNPKLLKKLPRPGAWMETLKVALSFPLFLWVIYLLNGFGAQTGRGGIVWLLTALLVVALGCWIYGHWGKPHRPKGVRLFSRVAAVLLLGASIYTAAYALDKRAEGGDSAVAELGELEALKWAPGLVADLQAKGHVVFVDYTADT